LDRSLPDLDPDEFVRMVKANFPGVEVVELGSAPYTNEVLRPKLENAQTRSPEAVAEQLEGRSGAGKNIEQTLTSEGPLRGMVGEHEAMRRVYRYVRLVAPRQTSVLVTGPTGSGKELVARALHELSPRSARPFVALNCAAIPETLLESELFGYTRGAFTGAVQSRVGRIQAAHGGTLFLDEIGDLPLGLQAKLLRFLECGELQRLGTCEMTQVDVRVVAATNTELPRKVEHGEFREDLYFRLSVFPIELPALADHISDIGELARHFLDQLGGREKQTLSLPAVRCLESHSWPGNVRELKHVIERAIILSSAQEVIGPQHIHFTSPLRSHSEKT
jgi:transcriptional regulator with GAF, ATPase, and Fis domain